jgi:hypothetical protein
MAEASSSGKFQGTPGPWRVDWHGDGYASGESSVELACLPHDTFDAIEIMCALGSRASLAEHEANARLIAAAPDLLEALEAVRDNNRGGVTGQRAREAWVKANAAIAKALGQEG